MPRFFRDAGPRGFPKRALRARRAALGWQGLVQVHHVLPRSLAAHPVVVAMRYDVEGDYNMLLLPTWEGTRRLRLRPERPVHDGGHMLYNRFAREALDACATEADFALVLVLLHRGSRGLLKVPWR